MSEINIETGDGEVWGGFGVSSDEKVIVGKNEPSGDWKIISKVQVDRPEDLSTVVKDDALALLDQAVVSLRRVAGMKEELREEYDSLSEKCMALKTKIEKGELTVEQALKRLDGDDVSGDKIEEL